MALGHAPSDVSGTTFVKPNVLLIASKEWEEPIRDALETHAHANVTPVCPKFEELAPAIQMADTGHSLFEWPAYDCVIVQDMWSDESVARCAGPVLSSLHYYESANFKSRNIVIVTDTAVTNRKSFRQAIDSKCVVDYVNWHDRTILKKLVVLVKALGERREQGTGVGASPKDPDIDQDVSRVHRCVSRALCAYICKRANIVAIDDERDVLVELRKKLPGRADDSGNGHIWVLERPRDNGTNTDDISTTRLTSYDKYAELAHFCTECLRKRDGFTIVVTDILFEGVTETGIDLIQALRNCGIPEHRFGILAYTSFASSRVAMTAYQHGTDFVVSKSRESAESHHGMDDSGVDRLIRDMAFLCFQKQFLEYVRHRKDKCADYFIERFLPREFVPRSLIREWEAARYLAFAREHYANEENIRKKATAAVREFDAPKTPLQTSS